jgi:hypothetical protein
VCLGLWSQRAEERAIRGLPEAERVELYRRTQEDLRTLCEPVRAARLDDHCRSQASFIVKFPECDDTCRKLATRQLESATR